MFTSDIGLLVLEKMGNKTAVATDITMRVVEDGERVDPTLRLSFTAGQQLIDELWRCGLRPSEGTGSAGSLAATERHLKDMQAVAMGLLRKDGVQI